MWKITKWRILQGVLCLAVILSVLVSALNLSVAWRSQDGDALTVGADAKVITIGIVGEAYAAGTPDYSTDGVADDVQFQLALNALPANGGKIVLLAGNYSLSANVTRALANVTWQGLGRGTYIALDGVNPTITAGGNNWVFQDLRTDAGGFGMGATTGWMWTNITINATYWAYRSPYGTSVVNDLTAASITDSGLTSGRVPVAGVGGLLGDDADLTWSGGNTLNSANATVSGLLDAQTGRGATLVVAASNASAVEIAQADYVTDGVADDVEINAAIQAIITGGGTAAGRVKLTAGQFNIAAPILVNGGGLIIQGDKMGGRLYLSNGANSNMFVVSGGGAVLQDLELRGNDANNVTSSGIVINGNATPTWLLNVKVMDFDDYGIELQGSGTAYAVRMDNVEVEDSGGDGIYLHDAGGHVLNNVQSHNNALDGIKMATNAVTESILTNIDVDANGNYGMELATGTRFSLSGYKAQNNGWGGLYVGSITNSSIVGGGSHDNLLVGGNNNVYIDTATALTFSGNTVVTTAAGGGHTLVYVNNVTYSTFTGNTLEHNGGRGFSLDGTTADNSFIGNTIDSGNTTARFYFAGTQAVTNEIFGNIGYIAPSEVRSRSGPLTAGVANAIAFAWHNPEVQDILVKKVVVEITTGSVTAGSEIDVGIADDAAGTNRGTEFFNNLDANDVDINDSWVVGDGGTQTKWVFAQDSASATDGWVVGQILTADAAALVGTWYVEYVGR